VGHGNEAAGPGIGGTGSIEEFRVQTPGPENNGVQDPGENI
jgi:hypothetical protein